MINDKFWNKIAAGWWEALVTKIQ